MPIVGSVLIVALSPIQNNTLHVCTSFSMIDTSQDAADSSAPDKHSNIVSYSDIDPRKLYLLTQLQCPRCLTDQERFPCPDCLAIHDL